MKLLIFIGGMLFGMAFVLICVHVVLRNYHTITESYPGSDTVTWVKQPKRIDCVEGVARFGLPNGQIPANNLEGER